jgi:hypothetical protein
MYFQLLLYILYYIYYIIYNKTIECINSIEFRVRIYGKTNPGVYP